MAQGITGSAMWRDGLRGGVRLLAVLGLMLAAGPVAAQSSAPTSAVVADGELTLAAPRGFCVDKGASRSDGEGSFILFGSCAALANSTSAARPKLPAILTASALPGAATAAEFAASFPSMAKFLSSDTGRAALSRSGKARTVRIRQIIAMKDVLYLNATDTSKGEHGEQFEPDYWRALFIVNGQIVTLSVLALDDMPLTSDAKRALLEKFVAKVKSVNRG
ncbi:MAG: hypothetical protein IT542_02625 [Rubellimicrobium sp.]|nr:hypothetical protein [Rubellimicrobium sp.]